MENSVLRTVYSSKIEAVAAACRKMVIKTLGSNPDHNAREADDLVRACLDVSDDIQTAATRMFTAGFEGPGDPAHEGELLVSSITKALESFAMAQKVIIRLNKMNRSVEGFADLAQAVYDLTQVKNHILRYWPCRVASLIEESGEAYNRGEYRTAQAVLDALRSTHSEAR